MYEYFCSCVWFYMLCNIHMDSSSTIHLHAQLVWLHTYIVHAQCETHRTDVCYQDHRCRLPAIVQTVHTYAHTEAAMVYLD